MRATLITVVLLLTAVAVPAFGQQPPTGDEDIIKVRQVLIDKFAAAVANKDVAAVVAELYTADAVLQSLCPETQLAFGRDRSAKQIGRVGTIRHQAVIRGPQTRGVNGRQAVLGSQPDDLHTICDGEDIRHHHQAPAGLARKCSEGSIDLSRVVDGCCDKLH